jgi:hypothetical protein
MSGRGLAGFAAVVGVLLGAGGWAPGDAAARFDPDRLARLTLLLGSEEFADREAAERELDSTGAPALPALKQAAQSDDAEVRRRAEALVQQIERRLTTARLLQGRRIRLAYEAEPVSRAVAGFAKETGFPVQIAAGARPGNRTVTLVTGELPFWEAFDHLCRAAGLVESHLLPAKSLTARPREAPTRDLEVHVLRQQLMIAQGQYATQPAQPVSLEDGQAPVLPTCVVGPIRVRALAAAHTGGRLPATGDIPITLEVAADPAMTWLHFGNLRIEQAVDENGHTLTPQFTLPSAPAHGEVVEVLRPDGTPQPFHRLVGWLKPGKDPSRVLHELSGTITGQVQTPPEALLTLDSLATGRKVRGADGSTMEVQGLSVGAGGELTLQVQVQTPLVTDMQALIRGNVVVRRGGARQVVTSAGTSGPTNPAVLAADGSRLPVTRLATRAAQMGELLVQDLTFTCRAGKEAAEGARLVYTAPRTHVIQVPFTLWDVPVPEPGKPLAETRGPKPIVLTK